MFSYIITFQTLFKKVSLNQCSALADLQSRVFANPRKKWLIRKDKAINPHQACGCKQKSLQRCRRHVAGIFLYTI